MDTKYALLCALLCIPVHAKLIDITSEQDYRTRASSGTPLVVELYADWCGVCIQVQGTLDELSEMPELASVTFARINIDELQNLSQELNVNSVPTFLYVKDGAVLAHETGITNFGRMREHVLEQSRKLFGLSAAGDAEKVMGIAPQADEVQEQAAPEQSESSSSNPFADIVSALFGFITAILETIKNGITWIIDQITSIFNK